MTTPTIKVLVGFQTTTGFGNPFQLNNATFGRLNTGTLGGLAFADLTSIVQSVSVNRGRNRQLDQFNAGTATVVFNNKTRVLDPLNTSSIYYPFVLPRVQIQIYADNIAIFVGVVTDWNIDYDISNHDIMTANCADQFTVLANQVIEDTLPSVQTSSSRVATILALPEVLYQGATNITTGSSTLGSFDIINTNCLAYLQDVATSEQGFLFMSAGGVLTFYGRTKVLNPVTNATFNTTGTGIAYQTLTNEFGDENLYNNITTQSEAGDPQTNSNSVSIALYQSQSLSLLDLLNSTEAEVSVVGAYLLGKYANPFVRFSEISVQMQGLSSANQIVCLTLDLVDICSVEKNFTTGLPTSETQTLIVSGIKHDITPQSHIITYAFESTDGNQYLTLDNSIFGTLNNNLLAF